MSQCSLVNHLVEPQPEIQPAEVTYIISIMSAAEAWKTVISKRVPKSAHLKLNTDEPWETMQAQLLVKIDHALRPSQIQYDQYDIKFYITRVIPKPGLSLDSETDYDLMILKARKLKDLTINITIVQLASDDDKENEAEVEEVVKPKKKAVRVCNFCGMRERVLIPTLGKERPRNPAWKCQ
jgi:hypothetical protein